MPKEKTGAIQKRKTNLPAKSAKSLTVESLACALLKEFPAADAEAWDTTGLYVGEGSVPIRKVAVALDPTISAIAQAAQCEAQVLVTHHPAYIDAPESFIAAPSPALSPGAPVYAAARNNVALMCFHTALDVSQKAQKVLPSMLGFQYRGKLVSPLLTDSHKGYGQICKVARAGGKPQTLREISSKCVSVFGRAPRVWGSPDSPIECVVTATGSAKSIAYDCLKAGADCLICGEIGYHDALNLLQAGMSVIELGHDQSELPLVALLATSIAQAGVPQDAIVFIDQADNWHYPEAIRL